MTIGAAAIRNAKTVIEIVCFKRFMMFPPLEFVSYLASRSDLWRSWPLRFAHSPDPRFYFQWIGARTVMIRAKAAKAGNLFGKSKPRSWTWSHWDRKRSKSRCILHRCKLRFDRAPWRRLCSRWKSCNSPKGSPWLRNKTLSTAQRRAPLPNS